MTYKFKSPEDENTYLELERKEDKCLFVVCSKSETTTLEITSETLYNLIGSLHKIQNQIKQIQKGVNHG